MSPLSAPSPFDRSSARRVWPVLALWSMILWSMMLTACGASFFAQDSGQRSVANGSLPPPSAGGLNGCDPKGCSALPATSTLATAFPKAAVPAAIVREPHPLKGIARKEISRRVESELSSLGSMSFGGPTRGAQINAVELQDDDRWTRVDIAHSWGTRETIDNIERIVASVHLQFPDTQKLYIGDISGPHGGHLRPHLSHQSGKDVDLGYYYSRKVPWYTRATSRTLDRARSWALVRALIAETDVRYIFIDRRVQRMLRRHAESIGEDKAWLSSIFGGSKGKPAIIRHEPGHATHLHARFYSPVAEETARRCYSSLLKAKRMLPSTYNSVHRVRSGETLLGLAKRYRTTVRAIQRANGLRNSRIQANRNYYIPHKGPPSPTPVGQLPARRVPPRRSKTNQSPGHVASR